MSINKTTEGLIKAAMQLAAQAKPRPGKYPRFEIRDAGFGVHRKRKLKQSEELQLAAARLKLSTSPPASDERRAAFAELRALPVKIVPVKYAEIQEHGRYTGERLRAIRSIGGGPKERARAARRAKVSVTAPVMAEAA